MRMMVMQRRTRNVVRTPVVRNMASNSTNFTNSTNYNNTNITTISSNITTISSNSTTISNFFNATTTNNSAPISRLTPAPIPRPAPAPMSYTINNNNRTAPTSRAPVVRSPAANNKPVSKPRTRPTPYPYYYNDQQGPYNTVSTGSNDYGTSSDGGMSGGAVFVIIIGFVVAGCAFVAWLNTMVSKETPATTTAIVAASTPPPETAPSTPAQQAHVDLVRSMTHQQRREYVANFLKTEKFSDPTGKTASGRFVIAQSKRTLNTSSKNATDNDDGMSCAICLDDFTDGEDICKSQNEHCQHQFHLTCAFDWLLTSQECPCCRRDYLTIGQPSSMRGTIKPSAPVDFDEFATEAEISVNVANNLGPSVAVLGLTPQQILAASVNHSVPFEL